MSNIIGKGMSTNIGISRLHKTLVDLIVVAVAVDFDAIVVSQGPEVVQCRPNAKSPRDLFRLAWLRLNMICTRKSVKDVVILMRKDIACVVKRVLGITVSILLSSKTLTIQRCYQFNKMLRYVVPYIPNTVLMLPTYGIVECVPMVLA